MLYHRNPSDAVELFVDLRPSNARIGLRDSSLELGRMKDEIALGVVVADATETLDPDDVGRVSEK
jgi:hypothetical protein